MCTYADFVFAILFSVKITVTVSDAFVALVQSRGLNVEAYAQELMDQAVALELANTNERHREAVDAMMRFGEERKLTLGGIDLKSMVHEGHKY